MCGAHGSRPNLKWKCFSKSSTPTAAISSSKIRCAAVCCIVLMCIAACCSLLQSVAACCSMRKYTSRNLTPSAAICSSKIRCDASHLRCDCNILQHTATYCNTNTATHCNTKWYARARSEVMLCVAVCCSMLQCAEMHVRNFDTNGSDEL